MKSFQLIIVTSVISWSVLFLGCKSEPEQDKFSTKFVSVSQSDWGTASRNFYLIDLSMRKIDSLSAELNLKFTKRNVQGLRYLLSN